MELTTANKKSAVIIAIVVGILIILVYAGFKGGTGGVKNIISLFFNILFFVIVVGLFVFALYMLFIWKKYVDAQYEVFKDVCEEGKVNNPTNLGDLWVNGDKAHAPHKYGNIVGWTSRQNFQTLPDPNDKKNEKKIYSKESIFLVKINLFKRIVIRCPEELHDELQGDVHIKATGLVKHRTYFYPDNQHLNFDVIDNTLWHEAERWTFQDIPSLFHPQLKKAIGILVKDEKAVEPKTGAEEIKDTA